MKPWEFSTALTSDRLTRVGDFLRRSRDSAARHAKRGLGDSLCSIGLVAFERSCHSLTLASRDLYKDWLWVGDVDNHFLIKVCGIPTRFYRGDADLPIPEKTLKMGPVERLETQLAFAGMAPVVHCLRFEVEKNEKGFTKAVNFVMVDAEGDRLHSWPVPRFIEQVGIKRGKKGAVKLPTISLDEPMPDNRSGEDSA